MMKQMLAALICWLFLAACVQEPQLADDGGVTAVSTPSPLPTVTDTATAVPLTTTPVPTETEPLPTASATATAVPTPIPFSLGEPLSLGRGRIVDAAFTTDGTAVAIAWAGGV